MQHQACDAHGRRETPAVGRIDLHSHLIPGVDDGCASLADAIECIEALMAHGYTGSVCTPHLGPDWFPENTPSRTAKRVAALEERLEERGLAYRLWAGGELRIAPDTRRWIEDVGVPTLGHGNCVLVDYWGPTWPVGADDLLGYLIEQGYQPILAHPERMGLADEELEAVLMRVEAMGVLLQGNLNSRSGGEGLEAERRLHSLLAADRYHLLASDLHGPETLEGRLRGLGLFEADLGRERLAVFLERRPREILMGPR